MSLALAFFSVLIVSVSLLGGMLPLASVLTHTRLQMYLSFAAGTMLGAVFFHMLPDAVETGGPEVISWAAAGLITLFLLERFFTFHQHEPHGGGGHALDAGQHGHTRGAEMGGSSQLHWGVAAFGLAVHTIVGGIALASALGVDASAGISPTAWGVFLATVVHKPADALTIVSLMLRAGLSRAAALLANLAFACLLPIGAVGFLLTRRSVDPAAAGGFTAVVLAFSAGTFLCIALSDLLPELQFHKHDRVKLSAALLAGMLLMGLTTLTE